MNGILKQFTRREAGPMIQFIKYGICGGIATLAHISVFYAAALLLFPSLQADDPAVGLFRRLGIAVTMVEEALRARNAMLDNVVAFLASNTTAYLLNVVWVFQPGRHKKVIEVALFFAVSGISLVLGTLLMGFLIRRIGLTTTLAFGATIITSTLVNYAMRKFVVFKG